MAVTGSLPSGGLQSALSITWDLSGLVKAGMGRVDWPPRARAGLGKNRCTGVRISWEGVCLVQSMVSLPRLGFETTFPCDMKHQQICFELKKLPPLLRYQEMLPIIHSDRFGSPSWLSVFRELLCEFISLSSFFFFPKIFGPNQSIILQMTESSQESYVQNDQCLLFLCVCVVVYE